MNELQWVLWAVSATLEVLVLSVLLRGPYKRYPFVFAYIISLFLTQAIEIAAKTDSNTFKRYFWVDDIVRQLLTFCIVITLVHQAMEGDPRRNTIRRSLVFVASLIVALAFYLHRNPQLTLSGLMAQVMRDLNFFAVLLNMALWSVLVSAKRKNRLVLALSGGLGIRFTGAAIGYAVMYLAARARSYPAFWAGGLIQVLSHHACLFIWWWAFRHERALVGSRLAHTSESALPSRAR